METEELGAFKTKLKVDKKNYPKQFSYLEKVANACTWVNNWYVRTALDEMKKDGITIFSSKKDLEKYSPRSMRKKLTQLISSSEQYAWLKEIPSVSRCMVFEHIEKTYNGGKGVRHIFKYECEYEKNKILEKIKKLKEDCLKKNIEFTKEMEEETTVFFGKNKKKPHKPDELYHVKGFPRFKQIIRHKSFTIDNVKLDYERNCITLPSSQGSKKFNVPKLEGVTLFFYNHDINPEGLDDSALYTFSFDGKDWWMSVKQKGYSKKVTHVEKDLVLGVDLGIKSTVCLSNGLVLGNLADNEELRKLEKKKKAIDRLMKKNLEKSPLGKIKDKRGKEHKIKSAKYKKLYKHQQNISNKIMKFKDTYIKNEVAKIPFERVKGFVFEGNFKIENLKKNKKWSSKVQKSCIGKLRSSIIAKARSYNIDVMEAPETYASSQLCSSCGYQNKQVKNLSVREWTCPVCGVHHDRDINASKNLANLWNFGKLTEYGRKKQKVDKDKIKV